MRRPREREIILTVPKLTSNILAKKMNNGSTIQAKMSNGWESKEFLHMSILSFIIPEGSKFPKTFRVPCNISDFTPCVKLLKIT
jgi:hypothetical protein